MGPLGGSVPGQSSLTALPAWLLPSLPSLAVNYCAGPAACCRIALWIWQQQLPCTRERQLMGFLEGQLLRSLLLEFLLPIVSCGVTEQIKLLEL